MRFPALILINVPNSLTGLPSNVVGKKLVCFGTLFANMGAASNAF
jgi:hypothetical protein